MSSLSYSAFAAACFSSSVIGFAGSASSFCRISSCRRRSCARARSTSRGRGPVGRGGECDIDRRRRAGASLRGEGEREGGDLFRENSSSSPGTGEGSLTADWIAAILSARFSSAITISNFVSVPSYVSCSCVSKLIRSQKSEGLHKIPHFKVCLQKRTSHVR